MIIDHVIVEAQNYEGMFNDILKLNPIPQLRRQIVDSIEWARRTLKKNDRVVWFLRWVKLWLSSAGTASGITSTAQAGIPQGGAPGPRNAVTPTGSPSNAVTPSGGSRSDPAIQPPLRHCLWGRRCHAVAGTEAAA